MKTRILAILLVLVLVMSLFPVTAMAETTQPEFKKVNMTLSGVLNVNFKVASNGVDMDAYSVKVTIGETVQNITSYTKEGDLYVYTADLLAHRMHENVAVQLMNGETPVGAEKIFTVKDHVEDLKELYAGDAELAVMLDSMVNYGTYAAYYSDPAGEAPNAAAVEKVTAEDLAQYAYVLKQQGPSSLSAVTSLYLHRACDLRIKYNGSSYQLLINNEPVTPQTSGEQAIFTLAELLPQSWGDAYNIKIQDGTNTVFEVDYSVMSYAYAALRKSTEAQTGLKGLLKAMYLYYMATADYAGANDMHTSIITPNSTRFLYKDGKSDGYIFMFDIDNANVKRAVDFINDQFNALAGSKIGYPGTTDPVNWDMTKKYIVVGNHTMFAAAGLEMPAADLGDTGYYIVTKGNSVFIMAQEGVDESQAYQMAALAFLKAVTGYEMYANDCVSFTVADGKNFTMPDMKIINMPDVEYRNRGQYLSTGAGVYGMGYTNNSIFMSVNGNMYHTVLDLLDPSQYYGSHKDWFYLTSQNTSWWDQIVGNQRYDHYQLCFSTVKNDETALDIIYGNMKNAILANPSLHNIALGVADNPYICNCSACSGDNGNAAVASYVEVANKLAERIAADPDITWTVKLIIFAYREYQDAPAGVTAHKNVGVMVAPIEASFSTPISGQSQYASSIQAWSKITNHLYIWYYQANFDNYLYPINSWGAMQENIQFALDNGADFIFYQNQSNANAASHFSKLKEYLESSLMVDADADYDTLVNNFFANYFGAASVSMKQYFDALVAHMNSLSLTGGYKEAINQKSYWPQAKLQEFMGYINAAYAAIEAEGAVNAEVYNNRIKLESIFPRFALLSLYSDTTTAGTANSFAVDCSAVGVTYYNEMTTLAASDYSGWWNHTCSSYQNVQAAKYLKSGATEASAALYFKSCSACGAAHPTDTFAVGEPLEHEHHYNFSAGTDENDGFDVGVCEVCSNTVLVKTDFTANEPVDILAGSSAALNLPADFDGEIIGVRLGTTTLTVNGNTVDTTPIGEMNHGSWTMDVDFTSVYGGTHTAQIPVLLVTDVISNAAELSAFAAQTMAANTGSQLLYGYYILDSDIDCAGASVATGGGAWNSYGFMGTLDGRDHEITNLLVNNQGGIFGRMGMGSTVKNIHFVNTVFGANGALFAKVTYKANFTNVSVDIAGWTSVSSNMTYAGILGVSSNTGSAFENFVIHVADGVSVSCLLGREFTGATGSITVNLDATAQIVNYYTTDSAGNTCITVLPDDSIITVNQKIAQVIDTEVIVEGSTWTQALNCGDGEAAVSFAGQSLNGTISSGVLTVDLTGITPAGKLADSVTVSANGNSYTYTNVWHVTQSIDTVEELKALGAACKTANTTGYYILGGDIDCSGEANMAAGNPGWEVNGFSGTFNGRGCTISNITLKYDEATGGYGGLFGNLDGCLIENVVFDQVNYASVNVALLGRHSYKINGADNTRLNDLTINISGWAATGEAGLLVSRSTRNTLHNGIIVNVADGVAIHNLLGQGWNGNYGSGITVNLGEGSSIASYYYADTATAQTTPPSIMTVNATREPIEETLDVLVAGEGTTAVTFQNSDFTAGTANVTINGQTKEAAVNGGTLSVDLADFGISTMGQYTAVIQAGIDTFTYPEVWYVTQVIDDVAELKTLGSACKAANTTGYYILSGDIDCSGESNMAVGNPGWQANGFSGTFNGRGHIISNIKLTYDTATSGYGGLFGNLAGATIQNVTFDKVNYASVNVALFGRHSYAKNGVNTTIENITINISGWGATGESGLLVSRGTLNTLHNNIVVNVADGLTIHNLLGQEWKSNYGTGIIVNLTAASTISSYYYADTSTAQTTPPSIMTVNAPVDVTLDTVVAAEGSTAAVIANSDFADGNATVTINNQTKSLTASNGEIALDLADFGVSTMGQYDAVVQTAGGKYTYTDVWYVTQSIDTVEELKALGAACKAANTTGYYILGTDIDCSGEANMAAGNPGWEANGFSGTFNGRNKTISNIKLTWDNATSGYGGLFGNLDGCLIENVVFDKVNYASVNVALLGRHTYKNKGTDNTRLNNLTVNVSNWAATGEAGLLVSRSSRNTLFNGITVNVADGVTIHNLLGQGFNSSYGSGITVNLGAGSAITAYYWTGTADTTAVTTAPSFIKVQ